jgi:PAS domain S-box-containing protein
VNASPRPLAISILPALMLGVVWVLVLGWIDLLTGPELALSALYLPGIAFTTWFAGRIPGMGLGLFAALVWMAAEDLSGTEYSQDYLPYWNGAIRLIYFETTAILISEVRLRLTSEQALSDQENLLRSILDSMSDAVIVVGAQGHIRMFNPAAIRLFQCDPLGQDARQWLDSVHPSMRKVLQLPPESPETPRDQEFQRFSEFAVIPHQDGSPVHLQVSNQPLPGNSGWLQVIRDVTLNKELERRIAEAGEAEQRRIGQDLHDGLGQQLVSVSFAAGMLQERLEIERLPQHASKLAEIAARIGDAIGQARSLARGLYPVGLEEGLPIGLKGLADTTARHSGLGCEFEPPEDFPPLPDLVSINLYRIAQECVNNALRHAKADQISINLSIQQDQLILEIRDDGSGICAKQVNDGIGFHILRNRANLIGADLKIESPPEGGTLVICRVPLK